MATPTVFVPSFTTSTNLGPLTTPVSFPSDCLADLYDFQTFGLGVPWTYETQGCALSTCCPSDNFYTEGFAWMTSYYSPGVCPLQYRSCSPPPSPTALASEAGEIIIFCCPTNYGCPNTTPGSIFHACASPLSTPTPVIVLNDIFNQKTVSTRTFSLEDGLIYSWQIAYPIQIRWKSEDFITTTTGPTSSSITTRTSPAGLSPTPTSSSIKTTTSPAGLSPTPTPRPILSPGAIVGVALAALICVAVLIGAIVWLILKRKKAREVGLGQLTTEVAQQSKPELDGRGIHTEANHPEHHQTPTSLPEQMDNPQELYGSPIYQK